MVCKITHSYKDIKHEINKQFSLRFAAQSAQIRSFKIKEAIFFFNDFLLAKKNDYIEWKPQYWVYVMYIFLVLRPPCESNNAVNAVLIHTIAISTAIYSFTLFLPLFTCNWSCALLNLPWKCCV